MLILNRKIGEEIVVPQCGLVFTVLAVRGEKVRVGISAPPDLQVHRREVWQRIEAGQVPEEAILPEGPPSPPILDEL